MPENSSPARTVLIIDDEPLILLVAGMTLEHAGFQILSALDGPAGIELFRQQGDAVDAVLLDISLPVMSGEAVLDSLQQIRPDVPVLISSGFHPADVADRLGERRYADMIQKPYRPAELVAKINAVLYDYLKDAQASGGI